MQESQNNEIKNIEEICSEKYNELSEDEKQQLHEMFLNKDDSLYELRDKLEKIIFLRKPPTPEEFLDAKNLWLPQAYLDGLYPYIKSDFIEAMNTKKPYSIISLYGSTRTGKSVMGLLFTMYTLIFLNYLRDPHTYFKINKMSRLTIYLVSFRSDKTKEVYLSPLLNLLDASEMFFRERFEQKVYENKIDSQGRIHFSEAHKFGDITFPKCYIVTGKDASSLIGANICAGAISELTFFKQYVPGMTDEQIVATFTKLFTRIQNTVGFGNFPCWSFIDSSANSVSSPIEKLILGDLRHKEYTFFRHYVVWKLRPHLYPKYHATGETFKLCTGDESNPPKIIDTENELKDIPVDLIMDVPIDLYDTFSRGNIHDSIRDLAGVGTGGETRFIQKAIYINNIFNNPSLRNVLTNIKADSLDMPNQLIWNQIESTFFVKTFNNKIEFYRAPKEPRFIGLDPGYSLDGDIFGFSMIHKEWSKIAKSVIYIIDFCFGIKAREKTVNLEAVSQFIIDLQTKGNIFIKNVFSDTVQVSEGIKQTIEQNNIFMIKQSVDTSLLPYQQLLTYIANELLKAGKNIYLKNNLVCLQIMKNKSDIEKIDHPKGTVIHEYNGNWETSQVGINAKDVSDAVCQALWGAKNTDYIPVTCYEDENAKFSDSIEDKQTQLEAAFKKFNDF